MLAATREMENMSKYCVDLHLSTLTGLFSRHRELGCERLHLTASLGYSLRELLVFGFSLEILKSLGFAARLDINGQLNR